MKMKKKSGILLLLLFSFLCLNAQENHNITSQKEVGPGPIDTVFVQPKDSVKWFWTFGVGGGRLLAEDAMKLPFFKQMRPTISLATGRWITPVWGFRLDMTYGEARGFALWSESNVEGDPGLSGGYWYLGINYPCPAKKSAKDAFNTYLAAYDLDPDVRAYIKNTFFDLDHPRVATNGGHGYNYDFKYFTSMIEVLLNANNVFEKPDCNRFFTLIPYGGVGWAHTLKEKNRSAVNSIAGKAGLIANFRIHKQLGLSLETNLLVVPEIFDRFAGDNETQDMLFGLMANITYRLGSACALRSTDPGYVRYLNNKINNLQAQLLAVPVPVPCPEIPECVNVNITGIVKDNSGNLLEGANVFILNSEDKSVIALKSDSEGKYSTIVPCGASLVIKAVKGGYSDNCLSYIAPVEQTGKTVYRNVVDLKLEKFKLGQIFKVENIYYDFDKWNIRADAAVELNKVARFLKENPQIRVELGSHTDSRGSDQYNEVLSQRRAESAVSYIYVEHGIDKDRITARGYGERELVNGCKNGVKCTDEQHQANRRTELKVTGFIEPKDQTADIWSKYSIGQTYKEADLPAGFFSNCLKH